MDQELKDYLDGRFAELHAEIAGTRTGLRGEITGARDELRGEIAGVRDENHQTRVLLERLNDKIDLVAEGVQNTNERLDRYMEENRREHEQTRAVFGSSIRHLERRVTRHDDEIGQLNSRVGLLEAAAET